MKPICKPKIGLVGVMCTPFRGDKEGNYRNHRVQIDTLAHSMDFDFHSVEQGVYNMEQATVAARELQDWGADFIILQSSSFAAGEFIYPFAKLSIRLGLWAIPEGQPTSEGGLPLNSFTGVNLYNSILRTRLDNYPWPVKWFWGHPGQELFDQRLQVTVMAIRAIVNLHGAQIGLVGGVASGFDNLIIDEALLNQKLGVSVTHFEIDKILQEARQFNTDQITREMVDIKASVTKFDEKHTNALEKSGRVSLALQSLVEKHDLQALAVSCWPRFQIEYKLAVCSVMGRTNSLGLVSACEGDIPSAVSMLALHYLTNGDIVTLMDLVTIDPQDESVLLWHCGPTSPNLADENGVRMGPLWLFDSSDEEPIGLHNDLVLRPGRGTVLGFTADFNRMLVLDGTINNRKASYVGSRGWYKSLRINMQKVSVTDLVQTLMVSGFQHHYPFAYGELAEASLELCSWLGIAPIELERYTSYLK